MITEVIPNSAPADIDWSQPNLLQYSLGEEESAGGVIICINEVGGTSTEDNFLAFCIHNSTDSEAFTVGRIYPGSFKRSFTLYDGQVLFKND